MVLLIHAKQEFLKFLIFTMVVTTSINSLSWKLIGKFPSNSSKLSQYQNMQKNDNDKKTSVTKDEVQQLYDDYEYCEKIYVENWIEENPLEGKLTNEDLGDLRDNCIDAYVSNEHYPDLSETTLKYMLKKLPVELQNKIADTRYLKMTGQSRESVIVLWFLKKMLGG